MPKNSGSKSDNKPATIIRLPPPIPAKLSKEVKDIAKIFKKNKKTKEKETYKKSYTQALSSGNNTREILRIKEISPNLQVKKIENIQKIINKDSKLKPRLNITTKRPLKKQVIVPINNDNIVKFMANSSDHITNINRMLKNIKSEIKTVYIHSETSGIVIVTDKVTSSLDLQTIEKYVKNSNQINLKNVETP